MEKLICKDKNGRKHTYIVNYEFAEDTFGYNDERRLWRFCVFTQGNYSNGECFELTLQEKQENDENILQVTNITHNDNDYYKGKGIPESLFKLVSKLLKKKIVSSQSFKEGAGEFRTEAANKMWDRLVSKDLATYNKEKDRYEWKS
jgi:hypothetical protein